MRFVLASTSPARRAVLEAAGVRPELRAPGVDEDAVAAEQEAVLGRALEAAELVQLLARAKAEAVAAAVIAETAAATAAAATAAAGSAVAGTAVAGTATAGAKEAAPALVFGGDSAFEFDGVIYGKPHTVERARQRWLAQRGRSGVLHSGHWLIDTATGEEVGAVSRAFVHFVDDLDDVEIEAYLASGEPLAVAGAFTIDSLGGPFIDRIEGDPSTVIGMSLPVLRRLVRSLGHDWTALWAQR